MNTTPSAFRCMKCGREASAIFGCPGRIDGVCPFVQRAKSRPAIWIPLVLAAFAVWLWWVNIVSGWTWPYGLLGLAPYALALGLLLWYGIVRLQLYDEARGVMLERTTLLGRQLDFGASLREGALPLRIEPSHPLSWPLSLVTLAGASQPYGDDFGLAARVLRDALLDLVMRRAIEIDAVQSSQVGFFGGDPVTSSYYIVVPTQFGPEETGLGPLESALLRAARKWLTTRSERMSWLPGAPLRELVEEIVEPAEKPADSMLMYVTGMAAREGFCERETAGFGAFFRGTLSARWSGPPSAERTVAEALLWRLDREYPDIMQTLYDLITRTISSRERHYTNYTPDVLVL